MKNLNIDTHIVTENNSYANEIDRGLRAFFDVETDYVGWIKNLKENTVYRITDDFCCCYIFMVLPDTEEKSVMVAGPYIKTEMTYQTLIELAEKNSVPSRMFTDIEKYFGNITCINDERYIATVCNSLAEIMWGGDDKYTVEEKTLSENINIDFEPIAALKQKTDDPVLSVGILEERYAAENRMMQAVSQGNSHTVEQLFSNASNLVFEKRADDPLRNMKNYLIISNTLLRKAAENGFVHPYYIDSVSTDFARKIEQANTVSETSLLMREMAKKYCSLVKTHSMKKYSPFVQKIITTIDSDLTTDLSLKNFARMLNVNASYLSVLFKKETGKTLTEYVSQKRIEHAAYLLRTTKLQVQTVAQHCGIYDVNYFAKIFKKITGKTPKDYRNEI